jgi:hypothetical protein
VNFTVPTTRADDCGPGLFARTFLQPDGAESRPMLTNLRVAGGNKPGSVLINSATGLLFALAIGLFSVSVNAQYRYVFSVKHASAVSFIEAISLDAAMAIFSLLALGLARAGKRAKIERALVLVCALASAGMNYAAADVVSPRSILAYVAPPLLLSIVVDRVVAVVRRHVLGDAESSPWSVLGKVALYGLRVIIAPRSTAKGARQALLDATPLPAPEPPAEPEVPQIELRPVLPLPPGDSTPWPREQANRPRSRKAPARKPAAPSKTSAFIASCEQKFGPLATIPLDHVYKISNEIAPEHDLHPGSARSALRRAIQKASAR